MIKPISTPDAPAPNGHYSQAMAAGSFLFVSTQLPALAHTSGLLPAVAEQINSVMSSILAITKAAGGDLGNIVSVTFYLTNLDDWKDVDAAYLAFMGNHKPARGVIAVNSIKGGWSIAGDAVCFLG